MTKKIMVVDLETFKTGDQVAIQQKQVLLEALADKSKVISNIEIKDNNLLITYSDGGETCTNSICNEVKVSDSKPGVSINFRDGKNTVVQDYSMAVGNENINNGWSSYTFGYKGMIDNSSYDCFMGGFQNKIGSGVSGGTVFGFQNNIGIKSDYSFCAGTNNNAYGVASVALGDHCISYDKGSMSAGNKCNTKGFYSIALGDSNITKNHGEFACGKFNIGGGTSEWRAVSNQMFSIGDGKDNSNRANIFAVGSKGGSNGKGRYTEINVLIDDVKQRFYAEIQGTAPNETLVWKRVNQPPNNN